MIYYDDMLNYISEQRMYRNQINLLFTYDYRKVYFPGYSAICAILHIFKEQTQL